MGFIDLHLHLDGSLSVESARELAKLSPDASTRQEVELAQDSELHDLLSVGKNCHDLNEYLERFRLPIALLQTAEALSLAVYRLAMELKAKGYIYAEFRFAPGQHTHLGLDQAEVIEAALDGQRRALADGFVSRLILCCMRGNSEEQGLSNAKTIELAANYIDKGVCAVDLAGAEALYATADFTHLFKRAHELGLPYTIHAGEAAGADSVWAAVSMGAKRIGHGQRAVEDKTLLELLGKKQITLEVCPTSNIHTKLYEAYSEVPLSLFEDFGVPLTICSDNMAVSMTDVPREIDELANAFYWDSEQKKEQQRRYSLAALDAAFLPEEEKEKLRALI